MPHRTSPRRSHENECLGALRGRHASFCSPTSESSPAAFHAASPHAVAVEADASDRLFTDHRPAGPAACGSRSPHTSTPRRIRSGGSSDSGPPFTPPHRSPLSANAVALSVFPKMDSNAESTPQLPIGVSLRLSGCESSRHTAAAACVGATQPADNKEPVDTVTIRLKNTQMEREASLSSTGSLPPPRGHPPPLQVTATTAALLQREASGSLELNLSSPSFSSPFGVPLHYSPSFSKQSPCLPLCAHQPSWSGGEVASNHQTAGCRPQPLSTGGSSSMLSPVHLSTGPPRRGSGSTPRHVRGGSELSSSSLSNSLSGFLNSRGTGAGAARRACHIRIASCTHWSLDGYDGDSPSKVNLNSSSGNNANRSSPAQNCSQTGSGEEGGVMPHGPFAGSRGRARGNGTPPLTLANAERGASLPFTCNVSMAPPDEEGSERSTAGVEEPIADGFSGAILPAAGGRRAPLSVQQSGAAETMGEEERGTPSNGSRYTVMSPHPVTPRRTSTSPHRAAFALGNRNALRTRSPLHSSPTTETSSPRPRDSPQRDSSGKRLHCTSFKRSGTPHDAEGRGVELTGIESSDVPPVSPQLAEASPPRKVVAFNETCTTVTYPSWPLFRSLEEEQKEERELRSGSLSAVTGTHRQRSPPPLSSLVEEDETELRADHVLPEGEEEDLWRDGSTSPSHRTEAAAATSSSSSATHPTPFQLFCGAGAPMKSILKKGNCLSRSGTTDDPMTTMRRSGDSSCTKENGLTARHLAALQGALAVPQPSPADTAALQPADDPGELGELSCAALHRMLQGVRRLSLMSVSSTSSDGSNSTFIDHADDD